MAGPSNLETRVFQEQLCILKLPFILKALLGRAAPGQVLTGTFFPPPAVLSLQAGFAAEGVESGTVFSDINLQEKVRRDPARRYVVPGGNSLFGKQGFQASSRFVCFWLVILLVKWP